VNVRASCPDKGPVPGRRRGLFLGAGTVRAFAEAVALAALLAPPFLVGDGTRAGDLAFGLVVGPLCAILFSARARLRGGARQGKLAREGFTTLLFAASCAAIGALPAAQNGSADPAVLDAAALCAWNLGALAFFRALAYLWPRWVALRRGRLRWEMTHATLVVVALVAAALVLAAVLVSLATGLFVPEDAGSLSATERAASGLLALGIAVFLTVAALGLLLPPAAAVSYFVARRTARRLESLARGAEDLREGNLAARVEVDGEDEVSSLQKDFNAMADDLQNAMRGLRSERDRVARLLTAQRELVASVSHELRTPLATVRGYLEWALGRDEGEERRMPEAFRGDLEVMGREVSRLGRLVDDLFVLSRAEAGSLALEIRPTDVAPILERCAEAASGEAWRRGKVEVVCDAPARMPPVHADGGRLEQAVRNLLQNAVRHTPPGGVVSVSATEAEDAVVVEVEDTGEGMPPEDLGRVFERFWRSEDARRIDRAGAGLGLALVRELVEAMGGTVSVESEPGVGSRFRVRLARDRA
jgi:signal transduction histidine kinase